MGESRLSLHGHVIKYFMNGYEALGSHWGFWVGLGLAVLTCDMRHAAWCYQLVPRCHAAALAHFVMGGDVLTVHDSTLAEKKRERERKKGQTKRKEKKKKPSVCMGTWECLFRSVEANG